MKEVSNYTLPPLTKASEFGVDDIVLKICDELVNLCKRSNNFNNDNVILECEGRLGLLMLNNNRVYLPCKTVCLFPPKSSDFSYFFEPGVSGSHSTTFSDLMESNKIMNNQNVYEYEGYPVLNATETESNDEFFAVSPSHLRLYSQDAFNNSANKNFNIRVSTVKVKDHLSRYNKEIIFKEKVSELNIYTGSANTNESTIVQNNNQPSNLFDIRIAINFEHKLNNIPASGKPNFVRRRKRISYNLDNKFYIDLTKVYQYDTNRTNNRSSKYDNEVEIEINSGLLVKAIREKINGESQNLFTLINEFITLLYSLAHLTAEDEYSDRMLDDFNSKVNSIGTSRKNILVQTDLIDCSKDKKILDELYLNVCEKEPIIGDYLYRAVLENIKNQNQLI